MTGSQDKVTVVSGGGSAIGPVIAIRLAVDGVRVAINDVGRRIADPLGNTRPRPRPGRVTAP